MTSEQKIRTEMVLGKNSSDKLASSKVILFGLGGVGSYVAEALARAGIGALTVVDSDLVSPSNINRQLCALNSTLGMMKTEVVKNRILDINPDCRVECINKFYLPENAGEFSLSDYDYIADAIDTVSAKIDLAVRSYENDYRLISCMGTGNKTDPSLFRISDIFKTDTCPLCKVMRYELKKRGVRKLNVVWSPEIPVAPLFTDESSDKRNTPGSVSFVPGCAGLIMAGKIITDLCKE